MRIVTLVLVAWLIIGVLASIQRGYFTGADNPDCARVSTIALTIVAGPLNYVGLNPQVEECRLPQPSE